MKQSSIAFLSLTVAFFFAAVSSQSLAGNLECPTGPSKGALDFSLPCVMHDPIPAEDGKVHFETRSADLSEAARQTLDRQASILRQFPELKIEVIGFADTREAPSSPEMTQWGLKRAKAVRGYLIDKGIEAVRITAIGRPYAPILPREVDDDSLALMRVVLTHATDP